MYTCIHVYCTNAILLCEKRIRANTFVNKALYKCSIYRLRNKKKMHYIIPT